MKIRTKIDLFSGLNEIFRCTAEQGEARYLGNIPGQLFSMYIMDRYNYA